MLKLIKQYTEPTDHTRAYGFKASSDAPPFLPNFGGTAKNLGNAVKLAADGPARTNTMVEENNAIKKMAHGRLSLLSTSGGQENFQAMALNRATSVPSSVAQSFGRA